MRGSVKVYIRLDNESVEPEVGRSPRAYKLLDFADYRNPWNIVSHTYGILRGKVSWEYS